MDDIIKRIPCSTYYVTIVAVNGRRRSEVISATYITHKKQVMTMCNRDVHMHVIYTCVCKRCTCTCNIFTCLHVYVRGVLDPIIFRFKSGQFTFTLLQIPFDR